VKQHSVSVIGAGPSGLMAAEVLAKGGAEVTIFDWMPAPARKFLLAGRGGLNLTHSEVLDTFLTRYGEAREFLEPAIRAFPPQALIEWSHASEASGLRAYAAVQASPSSALATSFGELASPKEAVAVGSTRRIRRSLLLHARTRS